MRRAGLLLVSSACAAPALATPLLDPMFADHAVIQRDRPISLRGTAAPGERITISFAGTSRIADTDSKGRWTAEFPAMREGGPYPIEARSKSGAASASDVMVGDIWLCSGQSNMEFPLRSALNGEGEVAAANDPQLRLMKIARTRAFGPKSSLSPDIAWKATSPETAKDFSAACYFMARSLRQAYGIPIGAIDSSWGGTAIHSWMDEAGVRSTGGTLDVDLLRSYRANPEAAVRGYGDRWAQWWRERSGDRPRSEPWHRSDRLQWAVVPKIAYWESWGIPALASYDGGMWARIRFTLASDEAAQGAKLSLGMIDDFDRTFVNGEAVGQTYMYNRPRIYDVREGLLKPGTNEILVFILDTGGGGGFWSPPEVLKLTLASGAEKPLAQGWEYSIIPAAGGSPPLPPWDEAPAVTTLYNGMIAPLGPIHLKGVAWYQGEADVGKPGYDRRLAAMMKSWRARFSQGDLPFLIVGLAGFGQPASGPKESNWAALINEQRKAASADREVAFVSVIDVGERDDIHPPNKQEVGRRLALAAQSLAYGDTKGALGPLPLGANRSGNMIIVRLDKPIESYGGSDVLGFELCGTEQATCRFAAARADGSRVVIASDGKPATRVRYAWADYPIVNLYGSEKLPVPPFELPLQ